MSVEAIDFKKAMQLWASGVTVVTTQSEKHGIQGMTATSFSSVSLEPPQILVCINEKAETGDGIEESQHFAVNILHSKQEQVSNEFAGGASQEMRFAHVKWEEGKFGMPILKDSLCSLECRVAQKFKAGTHWVIIGEVMSVLRHQGDPLIYYKSDYNTLFQESESNN